MNLLCPNCQKRLTVPDQFAGQLMKCPLCSSTFNVPGLPSAALPDPASPLAAPPAAVHAAPVETYGLQPETPAPPPVPSPAPLESAPVPASAPTTPERPAARPPVRVGESSMGYAQTRMITFSPRVLQWIPAACVVLIFIVQFFPWVGVYPGGVAAAWQGAWGIAFAAYGEEKDMDSVFRFTTDADLTKSKDAKDDEKVKDNRPGVGVLMIFYLLPFFFVTLIVTVGVVVVTVVPIVLPPSLEQWMTMRWTIVTGLNAVTFLFLVLQLLLGFPLENTLKEWQADRLEREEKARKDGDVKPPKVVQEARRGVFNQSLHRTFWLYAAVDLHLLAIAAAVMMASMEKRGNRPPPRLVLET